jgi:hypothetical protein
MQVVVVVVFTVDLYLVLQLGLWVLAGLVLGVMVVLDRLGLFPLVLWLQVQLSTRVQAVVVVGTTVEVMMVATVPQALSSSDTRWPHNG